MTTGVVALVTLSITPRAAAPSDAQLPNQRETPGTAIVRGTVVDDATGRPVEGVRVTRWQVTSGNIQTEVVTDRAGRFLYTHVPAGDFRLVAEMAGYSTGSYGRRRPDGPDWPLSVTEGARLTGIVLRLFGTGILNGTVRDEFGDPVPTVSLFALRVVPEAFGSPSFEFPRSGRTDGRGRFSLSVPAGQYAIVVPPSNLFTAEASHEIARGRATILAADLRLVPPASARATPMPYVSPAGTGRGYSLSTYPADAFGDRPVFAVAESGQTTAGLDISLRATPLTTISGSVLGPDGPVAGAGVRLVPELVWRFASGGGTGFDGGATTTGADGRFTVAAVPAGRYDLLITQTPQRVQAPAVTSASIETPTGAIGMATSATSESTLAHGPTLWVRTPIEVGGDPLVGLVLTAQRGARMTGRVEFEGVATLPEFVTSGRLSVWLQSFGNTPAGMPIHRVERDGTFMTAEYRPGTYTVAMSGVPGWVVSSVRSGTRDLQATPFEISRDDLTGVVVTLTNRLATLTGVVRTASGEPDADASVVVWSPKASYRQGRLWPAIQQTRARPDGSFLLERLLPGEYLVAAVDDAALGRMNADVFARLVAAGRRVTVAQAVTPPVLLTTADTATGGRRR
jgi:hypothetical protein